MPFDEWLKGDEDPNKILGLRREAGLSKESTKDIIVNSRVKNDIEIEEGKTYLVYMYHVESFNQKNEYTICGFQYGLREIQNPNENLKDLKVKNNDTKKFENIYDVINISSK